MSSDKLQLPDFLIAELYSNCIVELTDEQSVNARTEPAVDLSLVKDVTPTKIKYLGQNKARIAVLVNEETVPFIVDNDLEFLTKILKACNFDLRDIAIINTHNKRFSFEEIKDQLGTDYTLLFDVNPSAIELPFTIPHFQVQQFSGCNFVCAPALNKMVDTSDASRVLKTELWKALQKMFNLVK